MLFCPRSFGLRDGFRSLELEPCHGLLSKHLKRTFLPFANTPRPALTIQDANCAKWEAVGRLQDRTCIETQSVCDMDQRVILKATVLGKIRYDEDARLQNRVPADGDVEREGVHADSDLRFEPLAIGAD